LTTTPEDYRIVGAGGEGEGAGEEKERGKRKEEREREMGERWKRPRRLVVYFTVPTEYHTRLHPSPRHSVLRFLCC